MSPVSQLLWTHPDSRVIESWQFVWNSRKTKAKKKHVSHICVCVNSDNEYSGIWSWYRLLQQMHWTHWLQSNHCASKSIYVELVRIELNFNSKIFYFQFCQRYGRACTANANGLNGDDGGLLHLTDADKQLILDVHNEKRNMVALGQLPGFEPASRMATVVSTK